jgi:hypothetical protein
VAAGAAHNGLALHQAAARVQALLLERSRLLREVQKKKRQIHDVRQKASREAEEAVAKMAPLVERHDSLIRNLAALFDELLTEGRLSARARKRVASLRRTLELQGVLPPLAHDEPDERFDDDRDPWPEPQPSSDPGTPPPGAQRARRPATLHEPEVAGAQQFGQERRSIRELFRNLARAVHPDQARHEAERAHRTEVMKEVTRAYEDGDLARLLELESTWQSERALADSGDALLRCRELERINRELLNQVRQLTRELRDAKQDAREASFGVAADALAEQASLELDQLDELYDFIRRFRDGELSLADLRRGPYTHPDSDFASPTRGRSRSRVAGRRPW